MTRNKPRDSSKNALLDVVVTFAARFDLLKVCLDAVYREAQTIPLNLYIIDNGSNAEERIANQSLFEERENSQVVNFESKRLQQNVGFPASANEGARIGKAPLIMFLSDDVELNEGTIGKVVKRLDDPQIGIVGIKLMFPKNSTAQGRPAGKVQHIGMCLNIRGEPQHPLVGWSPDNPKTCISREVWAVTGACLTVRRSLFEKVGMFDMVYGLGTFEDLSLCMAVRQLGSKVFIDTDATGYHYVGATAEKRQESFPLTYNLNMFRTKWTPSGLIAYGMDKEGDTLGELDFW
jgi:GT2 family glycosyltransferase